MAETTFGALVTQNSANVRKALAGGVLIGQIGATVPTTLTVDSSETPGTPVLQTLTGFTSLGWIGDSGAVFAENEDQAAVKAWGSLEPVRTDITSDVTTLKVTGVETNKTVLATYFDVDPSTLTPDSTTAELSILKAVTPVAKYYRVIVLSQDGATGSETWMARILPRAQVTAHGDQSFDSGDDPLEWDFTLTAYKDTGVGYSVRTVFAGPGWKANKTAAGFS